MKENATSYDVVIIGGGIIGCGCAADAAMRGLKVLLCEQDDLGSKTSANSSKLIHGGLRYLENYDFNLVRKSLKEQKILLKIAEHLVTPIPFMLPVSSIRPVWLLKIGLFFYDNLIKKSSNIPKSKYINRTQHNQYFTSLNSTIMHGFVYYDCITDDSRLTVLNAIQAREHGANILTNTKLISAKNNSTNWSLTLENKYKQKINLQAKVVINAAGPWAESVAKTLNVKLKNKVKLVKGSHILVPKLFDGKHSYILENTDGRIVFAIPYHDNTMIGTTEYEVESPHSDISISNDECEYLLGITNKYFKSQLQPKDVSYTWSGLRTLGADKQKNNTQISRDYTLELNKNPNPCITIIGGKLTIYRKLASDVIDKLKVFFPHINKCQTHNITLPGASTKNMLFSAYKEYAAHKYSWLSQEVLQHLLKTYGTITEEVLQNCNDISDLGVKFTNTLYQTEVDYLLKHEWATNIDDILWRRTKHGINTNGNQRLILEEYIRSANVK